MQSDFRIPVPNGLLRRRPVPPGLGATGPGLGGAAPGGAPPMTPSSGLGASVAAQPPAPAAMPSPMSMMKGPASDVPASTPAAEHLAAAPGQQQGGGMIGHLLQQLRGGSAPAPMGETPMRAPIGQGADTGGLFQGLLQRLLAARGGQA